MPTHAGDPSRQGGPAAPGTPIVATDVDGLVTVWNDAAETTFGWDAVDVRGQPCPIDAVGRGEATVPGVLGGAPRSRIAEAEVTNRPVTVTTRDGERMDLRLSQSPVLRNGVVEGVVATFTGPGMAEREAERLRQTAGVIAHDLRSPLNAALASLSLLDRDGDDEHVARAERCLDRMAGLVEELHAAGQHEPAAMDPREVPIARIAEAAWQTTETADAVLSIDGVAVEADPAELQKLLANLFTNALEHAGDDVTVRIGPLADGGFYVEDDGPGVPPAEREDVFAFGYSGDADGTGYGLTIVERVADAHGWDVALTKSADGGARFEFS